MHKLTLALALAALLAPLAGAGGRTSTRSYSSASRSSSTRARTPSGSYSTSRSTSSARPKAIPAPSRTNAVPKVRTGGSPSTKCLTCERDSRGRIKRDDAAKRRFQKANPCPVTGKTSGGCPGYEIDHKVPLSKGGADAPSNMQWLTEQQHKGKHSGAK